MPRLQLILHEGGNRELSRAAVLQEMDIFGGWEDGPVGYGFVPPAKPGSREVHVTLLQGRREARELGLGEHSDGSRDYSFTIPLQELRLLIRLIDRLPGGSK